MRVTDRKIKSCLAGWDGNSGEQQKLEETIARSKAAFLEGEARHVLSRAEFICLQGSYIRKRWWVIQAVLLFMLWWVLKHTGSNYYVQRCMGVTAPLLVVAVMPELWKNRNTNAMEVECTAYYSLRQIYAVRIFLFALVDLFFMSVFFLAVSCTTRLTVWELVVQFLLPFNVSCGICFRTLYGRKANSEAFALFLCVLWGAVWMQIVLNDEVYRRISDPVWAILVLASMLHLVLCIRAGQKKCEEMRRIGFQWN